MIFYIKKKFNIFSQLEFGICVLLSENTCEKKCISKLVNNSITFTLKSEMLS